MNEVAIVVPAFNESSTIRDVATRARSQCDIVIVVDDGSAQPLAVVLDGLDVTVIEHQVNRGKAAAICSGAQAAVEAGAKLIVTLDGDGQHRPEDLPLFLQLAGEYPGSIIIGARTGDRSQRPAARYRANQIADFWISWAAGYPIQDSQSGFRLYPAGVFADLDLQTSKRHGFVFESEILIDAANKGIGSQSLEIADIGAEVARPSHFRPVADITNITLMVGGRLIRRGLYLPGLYRSFIRPRVKKVAPPGFDRDALLALMLSLLVGVATMGVLYLWFIYRVHRTAALAPDSCLDADAVLVLGYQLDNGQLSSEFERRLQRVLLLYQMNPAADIYITGGGIEAGPTEAEVGHRYLVAGGVSGDRVRREDTSTNTVENLAEIRPMLAVYKNVALVTSRYHLERSMTIAAGMEMSLQPCGAESRYSFQAVFPKAFIEAFFLHWYWSGRVFGSITRNNRILGKLGMVR